ncbi:MAG: archease [Bdellovibrionota bacterium]
MDKDWEHFEHAADVGVRGFGKTPAEAFANAGRALFALVAEDLAAVKESREEKIACRADSLDELFLAFLGELIWLSDTRHFVFGRFEVAIKEPSPGTYELTASAFGEPYDPAHHASTVEPKGATYTALKVTKENERWVAQCVVDV